MNFEKQLLSCYLSGAPINSVVSDNVFQSNGHKVIFNVIKRLIAHNVTPDIAILASELERSGSLEAAGGVDYIASLTNGALVSNVAFYEAEILREHQRRMGKTAALELQEALSGGNDVYKAVTETLNKLSAITAKASSPADCGISFSDLLKKDFPPNVWFVENLICAGLTVLTGSSKIGKSWTALQLITAVDQGSYFLGSLKAAKADCLYLALEDTPRRIQNRLKKQGEIVFNGSRLETSRRSVSSLRAYLKDNPQYRLVIIDTLQKMLGMDDLNDYSQTVNGLSALKEIADSLNIAVVVIHHNRKGSALDTDFMESALGSTGINATADCTLTMRRKRGEANATLSVTGRDLEDSAYTLVWDSNCCSWTVTEQGPLQQAAPIPEAQKQIIDLLESEDRNWTTGEIAEKLGKSIAATSNLLKRLHEAGHIEAPYYGQYRQKEVTHLHTSLGECESVKLEKTPNSPEMLPEEAPEDFFEQEYANLRGEVEVTA